MSKQMSSSVVEATLRRKKVRAKEEASFGGHDRGHYSMAYRMLFHTKLSSHAAASTDSHADGWRGRSNSDMMLMMLADASQFID